MTQELKHCPFCGSNAELVAYSSNSFVKCKGCGASSDDSNGVHKWNTRAEPAPLPDEVEKALEKAAVESIAAAKEEALTFLAHEREKIMRMSHEEALIELVRVHKIDSRMSVIRALSDNNILGIK